MSGSGISWAICKSAPRSRQITTPAPHHPTTQFFTGRMPFLPPNQQHQSTEGTWLPLSNDISSWHGTEQQTRCSGMRMMWWTDRQTPDQFHRPCSTYYASSANNTHVVRSVVCVSACQLDNNSEPCKNGLNLSRQQHLQNALFDALRQLSGTHYRKLFSVVTLLHFLSQHVDKRHSSFRRLSLLSLLTNTLPGPSASKVTTLWCYTNLFIIIIIK